MNKLKSTAILLFILVTFVGNAQVTVYKSYEDFQNKKGENYDDYHGFMHSAGNVKLTFKKEGKKNKIHCKEMWGFQYNEALFRIDNNNQPARVISVGKIIYYENGIAHLSMIRDNKESGDFSIGYYCYVSKNINSELIPMPASLISDARKKIKKFKAENSEYKELFDCIENNYSYYNVRPCVEEFEKNE